MSDIIKELTNRYKDKTDEELLSEWNDLFQAIHIDCSCGAHDVQAHVWIGSQLLQRGFVFDEDDRMVRAEDLYTE